MHTGAWQHAWHEVCLVEYSDRDKIKGWISDYMLSFFPSIFMCYFAFSCSENMGNKIRKAFD
jgi:hypothetical protein